MSGLRAHTKTHMTEPTTTVNNTALLAGCNLDIAKPMRLVKRSHKALSNPGVCPQLPCKSQGHIPLPNTMTLHAFVTEETLA